MRRRCPRVAEALAEAQALAQALGRLGGAYDLTIGTRNAVYKVTGVIDKVPDNSHFHFDAFLSMSTFPITNKTWSNLGYYTYLLLNKNADPKKLEAKFPQLVAKYVVPEIQHDMGVSLAEAQKSVNTFRFSLRTTYRYSFTLQYKI